MYKIIYDTLRINFKTYNTILRMSMCAAQQLFLAFTFEKYKLHIINTWKTLMKYSQKGNKNTSPSSLNVNGTEITNTLDRDNMFNTIFMNVGNDLTNKNKLFLYQRLHVLLKEYTEQYVYLD